MTDRLPPEGRLTDQQRDRIRAGLLAAASAGGDSGRSRPWLVPVAAAAAVGLLLAGSAVGGYALMNGDDEGGSTSVAGQGVGPDPTGSVATADSTPFVTTDPGTPTSGPRGRHSCDREVEQFLPGATMTADVPYGNGFDTYLYATDTEWVVCDTWALVDGGAPTLTGIKPLTAGPSKDRFLISMNFSMNAGDGGQFFAGGARVPGVSAISYRFPTGDTADATITDQMWVMQYLMPKPPHRIWTDPVVVTVTLDDGSTQQYDLTAMDLCAQLNHGC